MATPSPGSFFDQLFDQVGQALQPPDWLVRELQRRVVLVLNHVLQQEPEAQARLKRQSGRLVEAHWRGFSMRLQATPAGLLDLGPADLPPDLTLTLAEESPWSLAQVALRGEKPPVRIAGDVQLAAEVQWLVDHVRWDVEEDLSRIFGDAPAHAIGQVARRMAGALRQFAGAAAARAAAGAAGAAAGAPTSSATAASATAASAATSSATAASAATSGAAAASAATPGAPTATSATPSSATPPFMSAVPPVGPAASSVVPPEGGAAPAGPGAGGHSPGQAG